eukprot:218242_1
MCRSEAKGLTSLLEDARAQYPSLTRVPLVGILKENIDGEAAGFQKFFGAGRLYLDAERSFYKAMGSRKASLLSMFWPSIIARYRKASNDAPGNMNGEGSVLGGVLVMGPGDSGIIFEHREKSFGDVANLEDVRKSLEKLSKMSTKL